MSRDRTARTRIRQYLASHGPVEDQSGHATSVLKDAVEYEGSSVAFIQMIAAMDRGGEIEREIKGKRTYRITGLGHPLVESASIDPAAHTGRGTTSGVEIDYERLAKAMVQELVGHLLRPAAATVVEPARADVGTDASSIVYARRLELARRELDELLDEAAARAGDLAKGSALTQA